MTHLVCLLEELSAKVMLETILAKLLPAEITFQCIPFEGKQDLEKQVQRKLSAWQRPDTVFLILRDQDSGDCKIIKKNLLKKIKESGKQSVTLVRIACHELESFYLGDLQAVEQGLNRNGLAKQQGNRKFKNPDRLNNAKQELQKITDHEYQQISGSRAIASYLKLDDSNTSISFKALLTGIKKVTGIDSSVS